MALLVGEAMLIEMMEGLPERRISSIAMLIALMISSLSPTPFASKTLMQRMKVFFAIPNCYHRLWQRGVYHLERREGEARQLSLGTYEGSGEGCWTLTRFVATVKARR
jgi:hypothetical protein